MNVKTSKVDPGLKNMNTKLIKERVNSELHNHHKTELLDENYREIYD